MKKMFIVLSFFICIAFINSNKDVIIPNESIRIRILANSNSTKDQSVKKDVKNVITPYINSLINNSNSIDSTRFTLTKNKNQIKNKVKKYLEMNDIQQTVTVTYGYNFFPDKYYKGVKYKKGEYESLLITLGNGKGDNFWCVLYPPLCTNEMNYNNLNEVKYKMYVKEVINNSF